MFIRQETKDAAMNVVIGIVLTATLLIVTISIANGLNSLQTIQRKDEPTKNYWMKVKVKVPGGGTVRTQFVYTEEKR